MNIDLIITHFMSKEFCQIRKRRNKIPKKIFFYCCMIRYVTLFHDFYLLLAHSALLYDFRESRYYIVNFMIYDVCLWVYFVKMN